MRGIQGRPLDPFSVLFLQKMIKMLKIMLKVLALNDYKA